MSDNERDGVMSDEDYAACQATLEELNSRLYDAREKARQDGLGDEYNDTVRANLKGFVRTNDDE